MPIRTTPKAARTGKPLALKAQVQAVLAGLEKLSTKRDHANLARFGITANKAFGVSVANLHVVANRLGRNHDLAAALWETGWYEARVLTAFVGEPARVTRAQMDRWCRDFDNWGICDTLCFWLFDRTPHAWAMIDKWSTRREEYQKRAAFALLASVALHDKTIRDAPFRNRLPMLERAAQDDRNFVKKGVLWALRGVGGRSPALKVAAVKLAKRLAASSEAAPRWVGKAALREMTSAAATRRLAARTSSSRRPSRSS